MYDLQATIADIMTPKPGWAGNFTTNQAPGAIKNGTRVSKVASEPGDATPDGTMATILGSVLHPEKGLAYFLEWDDRPKCAVLCMAWKVRET